MKESDILAVTKSISSEDIVNAYDAGIFPWPFSSEDDFIPWCSPDPRGVLDFKDLHISKSTLKNFKQSNFNIKFCTDFETVIDLCSKVPRKGQDGTWISDDLKNAYTDLFRRQKAYSVEVYNEDDLVGGMYGVISTNYISGESMFHLETGASKLALVSLIRKLEGLGLSWIDIQALTPLTSSFGGKEITKKAFLCRLKEDQVLNKNFFERLKQHD